VEDTGGVTGDWAAFDGGLDKGVPWYAPFGSADEYMAADSALWAERGREPKRLSAHSREEVGQKRFLTAREIASLAPPEVPWVARPWVASAALTEVEGKIKTAGKTTWVMHLCRSVLEGRP
jgi:hypothetical protein